VCGCTCASLSLFLFSIFCPCFRVTHGKLSPLLSHARFVFLALSRPTCSVSTRIHPNSHLRQHLHYTIESRHTIINHVAVCTCSWHDRPNSRLRQHVHYLIESRHTYVSVMSQVCVSHGAHVCTANCGNTCVISIILFELCNTNMCRMILVPTATSSHVTHVYESCHGCGGHMCESNYRSPL